MVRAIKLGAGVKPGLLCALAFVLLCACREVADGKTAEPSAIPGATPSSTARETEPTASVTVPAPEAPITPTPHDLAAPTPFPPDRSTELLVLANETTLAPSTPICVGDGLFVAEDGAVHTLGWHDERACASVIDVQTGAVTSVDPLDFPQPFGDLMQASDSERARVYHAKNGVVLSVDCCGRESGAVLFRPHAAPMDLSADTALRFDERNDWLYLSYQDYDGQNWVTSIDLVTGNKLVDIPVLPGPWALLVDADAALIGQGMSQLVFADASALVVLDGGDLTPVGRLSLSRQPMSAVVGPEGARLFVTDAGGDLYVLDAVTLEEEQRLPGVGAGVDLDPRLGQLYVGDRYSGGVNVFDLATLERLGRIPQPGEPVASPVDGQVYILEEDVYQADGKSLELVRGRTVRYSGCEGCVYPAGLVVDPHNGTVFTATGSFVDGKPALSEWVTIDPQSGRAYVARSTGGHHSEHSLALYRDLSESAPLRSVDGLYGDLLFSPVSNQLYLAHDGYIDVIDGQTLALLGSMPVGDGLQLLAIDGVTGALYVAQGERLLRYFSTQGR